MTKWQIIKKDAETTETLAGAKFNILDENNNIVFADVTTDETGTVTLEGIMPGKYYVQEIKSPDGYTIYEKPIEVEIELNQACSLGINNHKKPKEEEKQVEDISKTVTGEKEKNLPRTGF